jgi:hypothetical protein
VPIISPSLHHPVPRRPSCKPRPASIAPSSLCLSLVVTLTMLVGVRGLSVHEEAAARFAMSMCAAARV